VAWLTVLSSGVAIVVILPVFTALLRKASQLYRNEKANIVVMVETEIMILLFAFAFAFAFVLFVMACRKCGIDKINFGWCDSILSRMCDYSAGIFAILKNNYNSDFVFAVANEV